MLFSRPWTNKLYPEYTLVITVMEPTHTTYLLFLTTLQMFATFSFYLTLTLKTS